MREIKFRGKRVDSGEWVYGYIAKYIENSYLIHGAMCMIEDISCDELDYFLPSVSYELVKTNTIGQYTGLKDANGVEIYEGDILDGKFEIVVIFKDGMFCGEQLGVEYYYCPLVEWGLSRNIIGNIHD